MPRAKDPVWNNYICLKKTDNSGNWAQCRKCGKEFQGIPERLRKHREACDADEQFNKTEQGAHVGELQAEQPLAPENSVSDDKTTSEPGLNHLKKLKRRLTHSRPAVLAVQKVNQLEEALSVFRAEVDLKLKIMQQILTTRTEQVSVQKKLLDREQCLYDTLLGHWINAAELAATGQSINLAEVAAGYVDSSDDEGYQYQSDPEYSPTDRDDDFGQPPVRKKSKSSLRRMRKSARSYTGQNKGTDTEIVKYSDSDHSPGNAEDGFDIPDPNNCTWEATGNTSAREPKEEGASEFNFYTSYYKNEVTQKLSHGGYTYGLNKTYKGKSGDHIYYMCDQANCLATLILKGKSWIQGRGHWNKNVHSAHAPDFERADKKMARGRTKDLEREQSSNSNENSIAKQVLPVGLVWSQQNAETCQNAYGEACYSAEADACANTERIVTDL